MSSKKKNEPLHFSKADTLSYLISQIKYIYSAMSARTQKPKQLRVVVTSKIPQLLYICPASRI